MKSLILIDSYITLFKHIGLSKNSFNLYFVYFKEITMDDAKR